MGLRAWGSGFKASGLGLGFGGFRASELGFRV